MHCATLEIRTKVEYTLVPFMLSFGCPAGFWPYLPSNSRSNALLLIFPCLYISPRFSSVLWAPMASAKCDFPGYFLIYRGG